MNKFWSHQEWQSAVDRIIQLKQKTIENIKAVKRKDPRKHKLLVERLHLIEEQARNLDHQKLLFHLWWENEN